MTWRWSTKTIQRLGMLFWMVLLFIIKWNIIVLKAQPMIFVNRVHWFSSISSWKLLMHCFQIQIWNRLLYYENCIMLVVHICIDYPNINRNLPKRTATAVPERVHLTVFPFYIMCLTNQNRGVKIRIFEGPFWNLENLYCPSSAQRTAQRTKQRTAQQTESKGSFDFPYFQVP